MDVILTNAGLQAIVNAEQTGTAPVVISHIAFGSGQYEASKTQNSLQKEITRLPIISGGKEDDNAIHVAVQDPSEESYSVYEFGVFLSDGTLFAVYSQTGTAILQKSSQSVAQFEVGIKFENINVESISFGDVSFSYPYATNERPGISELATNEEVQAGTDTMRVVTPAGLNSRTATETRTGIVSIATKSETITGTNTSKAVTPKTLTDKLNDVLKDIEIDSESRVINSEGNKIFSLYPSGRSVEHTARAGLCQKTLARFSNDDAATILNLFKSRGTVVRQSKSVLPGDIIGTINFLVDNGKLDYDGTVIGARAAYIQTNILENSTASTAGSYNLGFASVIRLAACKDGDSLVGEGVEIMATQIRPSTDNALNNGSSARRWKAVYAVTGTIQTSDENFKTEISEIPEVVFKAWEKVKFCQFKFKDAVKEKGDEARIHIGLIAQRIIEAFESENLNAFEYGLICKDKTEEGNEILSLRYDECLALECAFNRYRFDKILSILKGEEN